MNSGLVVLMGLGVVFFGLICIIFVCKIMSFIVGKIDNATSEVPANQVPSQSAPAAASTSDIPSRPELAAVIAAAIAEYTGKDISGIRIHSIKKL